MAKEFVRKVGEYQTLFRDSKSGLAWINDESTGLGHSCHPNISASGSVSGMKKLGYWSKKDRIVRSHGFAYNIDRFVIDQKDKFDQIVSEECMCQACIERRIAKKEREND